MSDYHLVARTGFGLSTPLEEEWDGFAMREDVSAGCSWISVAPGEVEQLSAACAKGLAAALPEPGRFTVGRFEDGELRILSAGDCQYFVIGGVAAMPEVIARAAAVTEQSDGWIALWFSGAKTRDVMERLSGLDLHPAAFATGACARAPIEGMATFIACVDPAELRLLVLIQRSSARSFADHVRHAAASACGGR